MGAEDTRSAITLAIGDEIARRYRVERPAGRGGMARVYAATDAVLRRQVALKVPLWREGDDPRAAWSRREARSAAASRHPNVVAVLDVAEHDGAAVLVMEHLVGGTLARRLATRGPLPVAEAVGIATQLCDALAATHAAGIVHHDVKPSNVLFTADGTPKLADFGIARAVGSSTRTPTHGSAGYMPPEQARGGRPDPRSDLYALGCVLFEMLTGEPPFTGATTAAVIARHLHAAAPTASERRDGIPGDLDDLVTRLLAKDPRARPASAAEVGAQLRRARGDRTDGHRTR